MAATARPAASPTGRPAAVIRSRAREEGRQVLAGVVAARVDEVALRQAQPLTLAPGRRCGLPSVAPGPPARSGRDAADESVPAIRNAPSART